MRPLILIFLTLSLAACQRGASTPQDGMRAYRDALSSGDQDLAWELMSDDYRQRTSEERFETEFERRLEAGDGLVDELDVASERDATLTAELDYSRHEAITLAYIDGAWRITSGVANFYDRSTPEGALVAFIHAVEQENVRELMALVPSVYRSQMTEADLERWLVDEHEALMETLALLRANADAPIVVADGTATIRYGGREMRFIREGIDWVIEDF